MAQADSIYDVPEFLKNCQLGGRLLLYSFLPTADQVGLHWDVLKVEGDVGLSSKRMLVSICTLPLF